MTLSAPGGCESNGRVSIVQPALCPQYPIGWEYMMAFNPAASALRMLFAAIFLPLKPS